MRKIITIKSVCFLFVLSVFLISCEEKTEVPTDKDTESTTGLSYIKSLGFSDAEIKDVGDKYIVDGDIIFRKSHLLNLSKTKKNASISQYGTGYYISINDIYIAIDPSMNGFVDEINSAISQWNNVSTCGLRFIIYTNQIATPHITIADANLGSNVCGAAEFPANNLPGQLIQINTAVISSNSFSQRQRTIAHEIGHAIGLRHTNWSGNENQSGTINGTPFDAIHIPGTPSGEDVNSLMNRGECGVGATVLSHYDKVAISAIYPQDVYSFNVHNSSCSSVTYSVDNLFSGEQLTWSVQGAATIQSYPSTNSATFVSNGNGNATISANVALEGKNYGITKEIYFGGPTTPSVVGPTLVNQNSEYEYTASSQNAESYTWTVYGHNATISSGQGTQFITIQTGPNSSDYNISITLKVKAINSCGESVETTKVLTLRKGSGGNV